MSALRILAKAVKAKGLVIHLFSLWSFLTYPFICRYNALTCSQGVSPCQSSCGARCAVSTYQLVYLSSGTCAILHHSLWQLKCSVQRVQPKHACLAGGTKHRRKKGS